MFRQKTISVGALVNTCSFIWLHPFCPCEIGDIDTQTEVERVLIDLTYLAAIIKTTDTFDLMRTIEGGLKVPPEGHHLFGFWEPCARITIGQAQK
jgi:hypothetical protein